MKLMAMHKVDATIETGAPPPPEVVQAMGAFIGEQMQKGVFLGGEGLKASATRARVRVNGGATRVEKGPYQGRNELVAGFCLLRAQSFEEAIGWGGRIAQALGEGAEVEVGPINEPWDMGAPLPNPPPPLRFLALAKADEESESGVPFTRRIAAPVEEMKRAAVLISAEGLAPSSKAKRVLQRRGRQDVKDGPFAESKELIAGYAVLNVANWEEALALSERFANLLGGTLEMDLRPVG